jgi:hypothetical protein
VSIDSDGGQSIRTKSYSVGDLGQRLLQPALAPLDVHQFHFGAGQVAVGAQHVVEQPAFVAAHARLGDGGRLQQHVVDRELELALVDARAHGGIALRVEVDHQHALAHLGQAGGQVDGGGGLADAALLVGDAKDLGHQF